jgi:hypothetical protein
MDEDIDDLPVPTRENFADLPVPNARDISGLPVPQQTYAEDKPKKNILDQAVEVGRQGLIGGIAGSVFPK